MNSRSPILPFFGSRLGLALAGLLAASISAQAGVTSYGVFKGKNYFQESASSVVASPDEAHGFYTFVHTAGEDELLSGTVQAQGTFVPFILGASSDDAAHFEFDQNFGTLAELNTAAPNGGYECLLFDSDFNSFNATLTLSGDAYPAAAGLANYAAAQQIDPAQSFTLQWTPPAGLGAGDYVALDFENDAGGFLASPFPWSPGALPGTTGSFVIPAHTLTGTDLAVNLTFMKVTARNTAALSGATGYSGYFASIHIPLKLKSGGGGGDTTPPTIVSSVPASLATGVPTGTTLVINFSEAMQPVQAVNWLNVPNAAAITYAWSNGGQTLTCTLAGGFPAATAVGWALNLELFKDLAGNALTGVSGGTFTTANSTPGPCTNGLEERKDFFFVLKDVSYAQTSAADPVGAGDPVASFGGFFSPAAGTSASAASVRLPNGEVRELSSVAGRYFRLTPANSEAALNAAFPAGNYTGTVTIAGSTGNLALPMPAAPPVPKCLNYAAAQAIDPAADFTVQWSAFTGASGNDRLEILITDDTGKTIYQAPDECAEPPRLLAPTATSVTLGAGLLKAGKTYDVELRFMEISAFASQAAPAYQGGAGFSKVNHFTLKTTGGSTDSIVIKAFRLPADGRFEVDVQAAASQTVFLEAWMNFTTWEPVNGTITGANGLATMKDQRLQLPASQVYRVRSQ